jgi:branched-chain amino acid transport system permease protein
MELTQLLINSLLLGGIYALAALGLNLIFGVLKLANIAHGDILMLGGIVAAWLVSSIGMSTYPAILVATIIIFLIGVALQKVAVEKVVQAPLAISMLLLYAISSILRNGSLFIWGPTYKTLAASTETVIFRGISIAYTRILVFGIAVLATIIFFLVLKSTTFGKCIRASAQHSGLAKACGIDVKRVRLLSFGLGSATAALAGGLLTILYPMSPGAGELYVIKMFAIVIVGGLGSFPGTFAGALLIALVETLSGFYGNTSYSDVAVFLVFILVLIAKPSGLFGGKTS